MQLLPGPRRWSQIAGPRGRRPGRVRPTLFYGHAVAYGVARVDPFGDLAPESDQSVQHVPHSNLLH